MQIKKCFNFTSGFSTNFVTTVIGVTLVCHGFICSIPQSSQTWCTSWLSRLVNVSVFRKSYFIALFILCFFSVTDRNRIRPCSTDNLQFRPNSTIKARLKKDFPLDWLMHGHYSTYKHSFYFLTSIQQIPTNATVNGRDSFTASGNTATAFIILVEWLHLHLLSPSQFHHYDDLHRAQYHQMRLEFAAVQAESYSLERTLLQYKHGFHPENATSLAGLMPQSRKNSRLIGSNEYVNGNYQPWSFLRFNCFCVSFWSKNVSNNVDFVSFLGPLFRIYLFFLFSVQCGAQ